MNRTERGSLWFMILMLVPAALAVAKDEPFTTGFDPRTNGFHFENQGLTLSEAGVLKYIVTKDGVCLGMVLAAAAQFDRDKTSNVFNDPRAAGIDLMKDLLLRAHAGTRTVVAALVNGFTPQFHYQALGTYVMSTMRETQRPVMLGVASRAQ